VSAPAPLRNAVSTRPYPALLRFDLRSDQVREHAALAAAQQLGLLIQFAGDGTFEVQVRDPVQAYQFGLETISHLLRSEG
jgi:hypothetical protein